VNILTSWCLGTGEDVPLSLLPLKIQIAIFGNNWCTPFTHRVSEDVFLQEVLVSVGCPWCAPTVFVLFAVLQKSAAFHDIDWTHLAVCVCVCVCVCARARWSSEYARRAFIFAKLTIISQSTVKTRCSLKCRERFWGEITEEFKNLYWYYRCNEMCLVHAQLVVLLLGLLILLIVVVIDTHNLVFHDTVTSVSSEILSHFFLQ
jgi:hypothetical protein